MFFKKKKVYLTLITYCHFLVLLYSPQTWGKSISEIVESGKFKVAVLRPEKDMFSTQKSIQKNNLIKEFFLKYSQKKFNKKIFLEFVYIDSFLDFWKDQNGKIDDNGKYTPALFKSVDAYFEFMSINKSRRLKADPIPVLQTKYAFVCNFNVKNFDNGNQDVSTIVKNMNKDKSVYFISIMKTSLDLFIQKLNVPKEKIRYVNPVHGLIDKLQNNKQRICTFADSFITIEGVSKGKLFFVSYVKDDKTDLAWWIKYNDLEINNFMKDFIKELKNSEEWNKIFLELFGVSYNFYNFIVN